MRQRVAAVWWVYAVWCACAVAALVLDEGGPQAAAREEEPEFVVSGVSFASGGGAGGAALAELTRAALGARGVRARAAPPPAACAGAEPPDAHGCLQAVLAALARGALHAALVPAARAPSPPRLRDAGLEELGDAAPPSHRTCFVSSPAPAPAAAQHVPRSLLDLADARLAALYALTHADVELALRSLPGSDHFKFEYENASGLEPVPYATVLTSDAGEASVLRAVFAEHGLRARVAVLPAGVAPAAVLAALAPRSVLLCGRALDRAALTRLGARALGPPLCLTAHCPFEARRLIKLVNARALAHSPSALRALTRLALDERELVTLEVRAHVDGARAAADAALAEHGAWAAAAGEVRVAVMVPATTHREAWDARALRAAAELAEEDEAAREFDFKAELVDAACSGSRAFKHLTDALGTEFGALSALAGPACGGAFGDVTRQSGALALPVLAYTAQAAPAAAESARLALLAAGDARREPAALAAMLARLGWRRLALLSELATRAALDPARLGAHVLAHLELPGDGEQLDADLVREWAVRAGEVNARILYVCVEDARAVRAALCAGRAAGLLPRAGAVWLLPGALPPRWLRPHPGDAHNCSSAELEEVAEGHLSVSPAWAGAWRAPAAWAGRWRVRCVRARLAGGDCSAPPPHAALLYDTLRLWAAALARLLRNDTVAVDDLHRDDRVRSLLEDAAQTYAGVTGSFEWETVGGARARAGALVVRQWRNGTALEVGSWRGGTLVLREHALRWITADGSVPDDGADRCTLQPLADALHADCRAAYAVAGALPLAALAVLAAAGAWRWRQRAASERRARIAALGMRALALKPGAPDRWEIPRERVVINRKLGMGAFGTVYGGHALLREENGWTAVAVKTLKAGAATEEKLDFLAEAEAMKRFEHENVVRLLGVVTETEPVCTVMEFMLYGDLKTYLVARRHLTGARGAAGEEVAPARLTRMARDVARALAYLARLRYVHRDVAARNCLVSAQRRVKLADFGMTRLVFEHDYYRFGRKGMLPVRWMAPESLALGIFSPASDVWSFGVLLYEIVTFGALPFQGLSNAQVLERVKAGRALDLPFGLKPQLEGLIKSCWQRERRARPSAAAVASFLGDAPRLLAPCLDLPLDALPLELEPAAARDAAQAHWVSWAAPLSAGTDSTYLSAEGAAPAPAPRETDAFLPPEPPPAPALYC